MVFVILEVKIVVYVYFNYLKENVGCHNIINIIDINSLLFQQLTKFLEDQLKDEDKLKLNSFYEIQQVIRFKKLEDIEMKILSNIFTFKNNFYTSEEDRNIIEDLEYLYYKNECVILSEKLNLSQNYIEYPDNILKTIEEIKEYYQFLQNKNYITILRSQKTSKLAKDLYNIIFEYLEDIYFDLQNISLSLYQYFREDGTLNDLSNVKCFRFYFFEDLVINGYRKKSAGYINIVGTNKLESKEELKELLALAQKYKVTKLYYEIIYN